MHIIGIRKTLVDKHPWLPVSVFKAFSLAKDLAMVELGQIGHLYASLPWGVAGYEAAKALLGDDYWSYGYGANRPVLETFARYHHGQGLSSHRVKSEHLFAEPTQDLTKI